MTVMSLPNYANQGVLARYSRMKSKASKRDQRMARIREVRAGNMRSLFPEHLTDAFGHEGTAVANFCDVVARDLAEVIGPLPSLACAAGQMRSEADKRRAELKNRIGANYWRQSDLDVQMLWGADQYITYGFLPFFLEPDFMRKSPVIQVDDPIGAYYELDRWGNVIYYAKSWYYTVDELAAMYPDYESNIRTVTDASTKRTKDADGSSLIELIRWVDGTNVQLILPARDGCVLASYAHKQSHAPVRIAERPGLTREPRGQFDDVIYVQLARAIMAGLQLEAAQKAVEAPIAMPMDVQELSIGSDAIIQTDHPELVRRVNLELPPSAFQEGAILNTEMQVGARYPDARLGQAQASVITGRGIQALMGGFDTQIKGAQVVLANCFRHLTAMAFAMDQVFWPSTPKTIRGTLAGRSYEHTYIPKVAIAGNYECEVTYGFMSGLSPQAAAVMMLQLRGDGIISRDTFRNNLPFDMDAGLEQSALDEQELRDGVKNGLTSLMQALGQMAAQGQDPTALMKVGAAVIKGRQKGQSIEDSMLAAFTAMEADAARKAAEAQAQQPTPPGGDPSQGGPPGDAQAGGDVQTPEQPTALPAIQSLVAGMRHGSTVMDATVRRQPLAQ